MNQIETNQKFIQVITEWDPFELGTEAYELEVVDVLQAVHEHMDEDKLAAKIQKIYEFSFEKMIPMKRCKKLAQELLMIKRFSSCD